MLWGHRELQKQCVELLDACVERMLSAPERRVTLGHMIQPILWRVGDCLSAVPSAAAAAADQADSAEQGFLQLLDKLILHAPPEMEPFLRRCQPLPEGAPTLRGHDHGA